MLSGQIQNHTKELFPDFKSFIHFQYQSMPVLSNRHSSTDDAHISTNKLLFELTAEWHMHISTVTTFRSCYLPG